MKYVISGGRVLDPASGFDSVCDVYIEKGKIKKIGENLAAEFSDAQVIDARNKIVAPGLLDMHCHLREPGQEYKEDIESGTRSASRGGFTSVCCMPNTSPVLDNAALIEFVRNKAKAVGSANVFPIGAVSVGLKGELLAEIGDMKDSGAVAISDDGQPVSSPELMRRAMEYADMFDLPVISHCEDKSLVAGGSMNEGAVSTRLGLKGIPNAAEDVQIARDVIIAGELGKRVHIAHVSTAGGVEIIRQAKKQGIRVTAETCPHYFSLTEDACEGYDTNAKMNPPLRTEKDRQAVIAGLADGTIDVIATDHAPHHIDEKEVEFGVALNGIVGFETALSLGVSYLVKENHLTLSELLEKMTVNPASILNLPKGKLSEGEDADIVIFSIDEPYTVDVASFASKSKNSPYDGFTLYGRVDCTIFGGKISYQR
ncbi:MAG: dihydroorotase [Clostridia bacterium]|nr:dihydroorotase [Clostridia bacterium]